jgi:CubicO group peptidase (beta-lactamase class C family)
MDRLRQKADFSLFKVIGGRMHAGMVFLVLAALLLSVSFSAFASEKGNQISFLAVATLPEDVGISSERLAMIDPILQGYVDRDEIAGSVAIVGRHGKIVYNKAFGMADKEARSPMRKDTIFRLASMTKPITAVAVMMLYEEGRLLLTDPVSKFIPEFKDMKVKDSKGDSYTLVQAEKPITIRHLLTHTSGIPYIFLGRKPIADLYLKAGVHDGLSKTDKTCGDNAKKIAGLPLLFQPGERWEYSLSFEVLGYLVEVVSGMPFDKFCETRIFNPFTIFALLGCDDNSAISSG